MEVVISICLGLWIMVSGIISYKYLKNDSCREEQMK